MCGGLSLNNYSVCVHVSLCNSVAHLCVFNNNGAQLWHRGRRSIRIWIHTQNLLVDTLSVGLGLYRRYVANVSVC